MTRQLIATLCLAVFVSSSVVADEDAKEKRRNRQPAKKPGAAEMLIKQLAPAELTKEQVAKIQDVAAKLDAEAKAIQEKAGVTPELLKKRAQAMRTLRSKDKPTDRKTLQAAVNKEAGFTEAQLAAIKKATAMRMKLRKEVAGLLTAEQREKLAAHKKQNAGRENARNKTDAAAKPDAVKKTDAANKRAASKKKQAAAKEAGAKKQTAKKKSDVAK